MLQFLLALIGLSAGGSAKFLGYMIVKEAGLTSTDKSYLVPILNDAAAVLGGTVPTITDPDEQTGCDGLVALIRATKMSDADGSTFCSTLATAFGG